jgi:glycosyltransferase involved in cell wall biosynthesis
VLVVPSLWWETFCLTIREGLMAGVPVVASDLGAMREALDGEEHGLLFRPGDARISPTGSW